MASVQATASHSSGAAARAAPRKKAQTTLAKNTA